MSQKELLCQLAEEAAELSQAALNLRRTLDLENPTPIPYKQALDNLHEEIADIKLILMVLSLDGPNDRAKRRCIMTAKANRWVSRLRGEPDGT